MACSACGATVPDAARFCPTCGSPLASTPDERRIVTVLFADVVGFTTLSERRDPELVKNLVDRCFERIASDVTTFGGRVDKITGDALMALFGAPIAHEDDAERAVRAALRMQETVTAYAAETDSGLRMRVGVNTGEVLIGALRAAGDVTAMGDVVNTANRLQTIAEPGQVLVGPSTYEATQDTIRYEEVGPIQVRGRAEPVVVCRAVEPLGLPGTRATRARIPLVGRKAELGMLWHALSTAVDHDRTHVILLVGDAGMGKTKLVHEAVEIAKAQHDALVLQGRCLPYGEANVWWPIAEVLRKGCGIARDDPAEVATEKCRRAMADLIGAEGEGTEASHVADGLLYLMGYEGSLHDLEPSRARDEAVRSIQTAMAAFARTRPLVIVLSELHWADDLVLELVDRMLERLRDVPVVLLATARPELQERWNPRPGRHNLHIVNLDPLDRRDTAELARTILGAEPAPEVLDVLWERSGGNPLFVAELCALVGEGALGAGGGGRLAALPATLRGLVAARLDQLPASERSCLADAAVIGRSGPVEALVAMGAARDVGDPDGLVHRLGAHDVIVVSGDEFTFRSDLLRDVAYETLTKAERARRHAALAGWLAQHASKTEREDEYLERIAHHFGVAADLYAEVGAVDGIDEGIRPRALKWLERAAQRAETRETWKSSVHLYDHALRLVVDGKSRRRFQLGRATARGTLRELAPAFQDAREALATAEADGDRHGVAAALTVLGDLEQRENDLQASVETLQRAIDLWQELGDRKGEADALRRWGMSNLHLARPDAAEDAIQRALEIFRELGERAGEAWALQNLAWIAFTRGEHVSAEAWLQESERLFSELGDSGGRAWAVGLLAYVRYFQGDLDFAGRVAAPSIGHAREVGDRWAEGMMTNLLGTVRLWQGRTLEAVEHLTESRRIFAEIDDTFGELQATMPYGWVLALTGRSEEALRTTSDAAAIAERVPSMADVAKMHASHINALLGRPGDAEAAARSAAVQAPERSAALALAVLLGGRPAEALDALEAEQDLIDNAGHESFWSCVRSLALAAAGRPREAVAAADAVLAGRSSYLDRVRAMIARGLAFAHEGRPEDAEAAFEGATEAIGESDDVLHKALVAYAHAIAMVRLGTGGEPGAAAGRLRELGVDPTPWETAFRLAAGEARIAAPR